MSRASRHAAQHCALLLHALSGGKCQRLPHLDALLDAPLEPGQVALAGQVGHVAHAKGLQHHAAHIALRQVAVPVRVFSLFSGFPLFPFNHFRVSG